MKKKITIIGAGMMGSALAFPAAENGHEVHIVGTCLDDDIIDGYIATGKHEKFCRPFPENVQYHYFKDWKEVVKGSDFVIGGVSSFGVDWFLEEILTQLDPQMPVLSVTKGLRATEDGTLLSYPGYWEANLQSAESTARSAQSAAHVHHMNLCLWIRQKWVSVARTALLFA